MGIIISQSFKLLRLRCYVNFFASLSSRESYTFNGVVRTNLSMKK